MLKDCFRVAVKVSVFLLNVLMGCCKNIGSWNRDWFLNCDFELMLVEAMHFFCFWACEVVNCFKREEIMDFDYSFGSSEEDRRWFMEAMQAQTIDVIKRMKEITLVMQTPQQVLESQGVTPQHIEGMCM